MFDSHIHSNFSSDSNTPCELMFERAVNLGLEGVAITDHLDFDFPDYDNCFNIDFDKYNKKIDEMKNKFKGTLNILKGIEVGIQPHVIEESNQLIEKYDFDFVISSTHVIDRMDPYRGGYFENKSKTEAYTKYLEAMLYSVNNFKNYDVVAHIGYISRYAPYEDKFLYYSDFADILDEILKTIIYDGKGIEINTSGLRSSLKKVLPGYDIITRYLQLGGEIITIGSDAHYEKHIGSGFIDVAKKLSDLGFKYTSHFEKRKPVFDKI